MTQQCGYENAGPCLDGCKSGKGGVCKREEGHLLALEEAPATWDAFGHSGMRYLEESDISGGETDR